MTLEEALERYPGAVTFRFAEGDPALSERLLALVRSGRKTATCQALSIYESGGETAPEIGRRDIALDAAGAPALAIETVSLETLRFDEVDEDFALSEGENDSLDGWRRDHEEWFRRTCGFSPDMLLVCERFRMVEDFG